jgi:hypothetical protein
MSEKSLHPAALILGFIRIKGIKELIESCLQNDVLRIYISLDGARNKEEHLTQLEIIKMINGFQVNCKATINLLVRERNLGVGAGVISGIDWFFSQEPSGHILEDDLSLGSDFFKFSREALNRFKNDNKVKVISGTQLLTNLSESNKAYWCNYPIIWGWSTWSDKWIQMRGGLFRKKSYKIFGQGAILNNYWAVGGNRVLKGKVDTWDTPLAAEFLREQWLCLIPPVNLVSNTGNDIYASHTTKVNKSLNLPLFKLKNNTDFDFNRNNSSVAIYNNTLEKSIFNIRIRHFLIPIYSFMFDFLRYRTVKPQLELRINL